MGGYHLCGGASCGLGGKAVSCVLDRRHTVDAGRAMPIVCAVTYQGIAKAWQDSRLGFDNVSWVFEGSLTEFPAESLVGLGEESAGKFCHQP